MSRTTTRRVDLRRSAPAFLIFSGLLLAISVAMGLFVGSVRVSPLEVIGAVLSLVPGLGGLYAGSQGHYNIVVLIRLPILLMGLSVGIALSSSGSALQGLFRNDLMDPFIIGISSGGALGWVVASVASSDWGWWSAMALRVSLSFLGAIASVSIAYLVARKGSEVPVANMLLAGIAVSALLTSAAQVMIYLFVENPAEMIFSLMGGLGNTRWDEVAIVLPVALSGAAVLTYFGKDLNAFGAGEEAAAHLGVSVERSKAMVIGTAALVSAITIPFCGIIGFVGLIIPHIARRFVGPDQRMLVPASAILGAGFLVLCDIGSRNLTGFIIPLGMVTGLFGGGFFLYLLAARRRRG